MARSPELENDVRLHRRRLGWSQQDLALRSGLSRTGISAIESGQLVPSTAAALSLAAVLGCRVDDLFRLPRTVGERLAWAWNPQLASGRYWHVEVGGRTLLYPVEASPLGVIPHDGTYRDGRAGLPGRFDPMRTLVLSGCDPAVSLLAEAMARATGIRLIVLGRSSRTALGMLGPGLAHVAGVHLATSETPGNEAAVREAAGLGFSLLRITDWEEGIALAHSKSVVSVEHAVKARLRWVGRELGSGARQCQDELLGASPSPRMLASDHRGVAGAIRSGWADAGICLRLVAEEAGLKFLTLRRESYDLCYPSRLADDPRIRALVAAVRSTTYRESIGELPGYDTAASGELRQV